MDALPSSPCGLFMKMLNFFLSGWHKKYPDNPLFKPSALLDKLVAEGKTGIKAGQGFYTYKK